MSVRVLIPVVVCFVLEACGPSVRSGGSGDPLQVGDRWNDADSSGAAAELVKDILSRSWLSRWNEEQKRVPRLLVGRVVNRAHCHINTDMLVADLERDLLNSGEVSFVASGEQRKQLLDEKLRQIQHSTLESQKALGRELGADFLLTGKINSEIQRAGSTGVTYYQTDLELLNIETGEKVWLGQSKTKKVVQR